MRNLILSLIIIPILCTACYWREEIDNPYPLPEQHSEYKSKLYYTTTDDLPVTLNNDRTFGIDILDMSYENGQGVITFDGIARRVGARAFEGCENLKSVTLPDSTRVIDNRAFAFCTNLEEVRLCDSLMAINREAFAQCTSLTSITIPKRVEEVGDNAFAKCHNLREFCGNHASHDGKAVVIDGKMVAFAPFGIEEYTLPNDINAVGDWVFHLCANIRKITIPDSVKSVGIGAFGWCTSLEEITFGEGIEDIADEALRDCLALQSIYLKTKTPPHITRSSISTFNYETYDYEYLGCNIYVPTDVINTYTTAEQWSNYAQYIKGYDSDSDATRYSTICCRVTN